MVIFFKGDFPDNTNSEIIVNVERMDNIAMIGIELFRRRKV
ncbi:hypothetical protein [Enterococcus gilvus]